MDDKKLLEKIDILRERMDIGYREAKEALDQANGDLVAALVNLEQKAKRHWTERITCKGEEVLDHIKDVFAKGTATKIKVKKGDRILFELPAGAGMLGLVGMLMSSELAIIGAMGTVTALLNKCTLEIEHKGASPEECAEHQADQPEQPPAES